MASHGIKDKVAIVGMGCTDFGEHWDSSADDMLLDAATQAYESAGVAKDDVDAYWYGTVNSGLSGMDLARPLNLHGKPVTKIENFCATGSEALRNASYAVASGAYDVAMAIGVEKVKDAGYQGLNGFNPPDDGTRRTLTAAAMFSLVAPAYAKKYGVDEDELKMVLAKIAVEEPLQRRPQPAGPVPQGDVGREDLFDAGGGRPAGCVRLRRGGRRLGRGHRGAGRGRPPLHRQAALHQGAVVRGRHRFGQPRPRATTTRRSGRSWRRPTDAYAQAGVTDPRREIAMAEVHDCFTPTELVLCEDLGFAERGMGWKEVVAGTFDLDGALPVNPDGGLKSFGHPVGASGLRMHFEHWLQLRGEAPEDRRIPETDRTLGLVHNLGGYPGEMVSFVSIVGTELG